MSSSSFPGRVIAHVDMDAFYASVEAHDDTSLDGLPVVVGGPPEKRGVVAAASYRAREFGIHSAMPMARAVQLCPDLVRISPRMSRYREVSEIVMSVLKSFSPLVEPLSLDEAFVDLTGAERLFGSPRDAGTQIRAAVRAETGLTTSVGVAPNKFLAKLASDENKPDGLTVITPEDAVDYVQGLPVERIWGVGAKTAEKLHRLGLARTGDIASTDPSTLKRHFGLMGLRLHELAWGRDDRPVVAETEHKSVSHEITFAKNQRALELLQGVLNGLCSQVATRLRKHRMVARTINLKLRYGDFTTVTRQESLGHPTDDAGEISAVADRMLALEREADQRAVRLLGVAATGLLRRAQMNLDLFGGPGAVAENPGAAGGKVARVETGEADGGAARREALNRAVDKLTTKFGEGAVQRGGALRGQGLGRDDENAGPDADRE